MTFKTSGSVGESTALLRCLEQIKLYFDFQNEQPDLSTILSELESVSSSVESILECLSEMKEKQPFPTGEFITDPLSPHCDKQIFQCVVEGEVQCFIRTDEKTLERIDMSESEINVPGADTGKTFESEILELIQVQADSPVSTVADAIALAEAAGLPDLVYKATGQSIPATADDICAYKVRRLPCGASYLTDPTDASTAVEVGADDAYFVGGVSINSAEDSYGAVDPARPVAAGSDAVAVWCFKLKRELSKADIAAL